MGRTIGSASALLLAAAALVGCSSPTQPAWTIDVRYVDLEAGTCLGASYDDDNLPEKETFDVNAVFFQAVDCSRSHRGQVIGVVEIPASSQWDDFGTAAGPSLDEASDWLDAACLAYGALVENYLEIQGIARSFVVSANYGILGDPVLGSCIAHDADFEEFVGDEIDIEAMTALAAGGFDSELLGTAGDWLVDPLEEPVATYWNTLDPFTCVESFASADEEYYDVVACSLPHEAQFLGWVRMPEEWTGYRTDDEAQSVVDERCAAVENDLATADDSPVPDIVVEPSGVGATLVVSGRNLAQCWAHQPDLAVLDLDLRGVLQPAPEPEPEPEPEG